MRATVWVCFHAKRAWAITALTQAGKANVADTYYTAEFRTHLIQDFCPDCLAILPDEVSHVIVFSCLGVRIDPHPNPPASAS